MKNQDVINSFKGGSSCLNSEVNGYDTLKIPNIDSGKMSAARKNFGIPGDETILFIRDTGFWNNCDQGLVLTDQSIYCIPDNENLSTKFDFPWSCLASVRWQGECIYFCDRQGNSAPINICYFAKSDDNDAKNRVGRSLARLFDSIASSFVEAGPQVDEDHEKFKTDFDQFLDSVEEVLTDENSLRDFIRKHSPQVDSDLAKSEYAYLRAIACMLYLYCVDSSKLSIANEGLKHINEALFNLDDSEYHYICSILNLYALHDDDSDLDKEIFKIDNESVDINSVEGTYLKAEKLQEAYNDALESKLFSAWCTLSENNEDRAIKCASRMSEIPTQYSSVLANVILATYYEDKDAKKYFEYSLKAYNTPDFEYDSEVGWHKQWVVSILNLSYCYLTGTGTDVDYKKGYEFSKKGAELEDSVCYNNLALCYRDGLYVKQDKMQALTYYRKSKELGYEDCAENIEKLEKELNVTKVEEPKKVTKTSQYDIFISYSRHNTETVDKFVKLLDEAGYSVWIDRDGIESGDAFKLNIVNAIESCQMVLYFSSEDSNRSPWTTKEIGVAVNFGKPIIPIKLDTSRYSKAVMFDLVNYDFIDYTDPSLYEAGEQKLLRSLSSKIVKEEPASSSSDELTADEQEYYDTIKEILDEDGEISPRERKIVERLRTSLGISEERAKQIEDSASGGPLTEDEQEYLNTYREMVADGAITDRDRKILDRMLKAYNITAERAAQIEK